VLPVGERGGPNACAVGGIPLEKMPVRCPKVRLVAERLLEEKIQESGSATGRGEVKSGGSWRGRILGMAGETYA